MQHLYRHLPIPLLEFIFLSLFCLAGSLQAQEDTARKPFFDSLETVLRADYRLCTADSSLRSLSDILKWKRAIDSISESTDYPVIVRQFSEETGIRPADARPCEIVRWLLSVEKQVQESARFLEEEHSRAIQKYNDSLRLARELAGTVRAPYDLKAIPFGLSLAGFTTIAARNNLPPVEKEGMVVRCDQFPVGVMSFKAAFHFNRDERYWCYELESAAFGYDSLDTGARPMMDFLAARIEAATGKAPDHIYRVGQFDIVPGRLSICKYWNFDKAVAYVGLARTANRFYAKTIMQMKRLPQ
jgi:hypothetical protein